MAMKVIEKTKGSFPRRNFWSAKDKETTKAADSSPNDLVVALKGCVQNTLGACMELDINECNISMQTRLCDSVNIYERDRLNLT